jgi:hypothetical protein
MVAILALNRRTGEIASVQGEIEAYVERTRLRMVPAVLDGDLCVKLFRGNRWIGTALSVDAEEQGAPTSPSEGNIPS